MGDAFLIWRETYAVGHIGLDLEHRRLVELINQIAALRGEASQQLFALSNAFYLASVEHFRHENSVMRDIVSGAYLLADERMYQFIGEAAVNDHCAEHAHTLIKLERMLQAFAAGKDRDGPALATDLRIWFLDHAVNHDGHLKKAFQKAMDQPADSQV
jgi:hemerythrin